MKKILLTISVGLFLFSACNNSEQTKAEKDNDNNNYQNNTEELQETNVEETIKSSVENENEIQAVSSATTPVEVENQNPFSNQTPIRAYESGDRNAMQGNPERLNIYPADEDDEFNFTYHDITLENDIYGKATWSGRDQYYYSDGKSEFYFIFDENDEGVQVRELVNGDLIGQAYLFKITK